MDEFEVVRQLGKGAFSIVLLVKRKEDGNIYAIKRVQIANMNQKEKLNSLNEVRLLASISHQNIIGYKDSFFEDESQTLNIVLEYADDGDLRAKIQSHQKSQRYFKETEIWSIFIQLLQGLRVLHSNHIMHRDLKTANIFLTKNGICKLGDLNVSKIVKMGLLYTQTGTPYYASPEVWEDKPYDYKSDIWSIGCILYELCALSLPFKGNNLSIVYSKILKGQYEPIPSIYSKEISVIIALLLQVNPKNRPNCEELMRHPIIKKKIRMIFGEISDEDSKENSIHYSKSLKCKEMNAELLNTIRISSDNDIKKVLPKYKKYNSNNSLRHLRCYTGKPKQNSINTIPHSSRCVNPASTPITKLNPTRLIIGRNMLKKHNSFSNLVINPQVQPKEEKQINKTQNATIDISNGYKEEENKSIEPYPYQKQLRKSLQPQIINSYRNDNIRTSIPPRPPRPQSCGKKEIENVTKISINTFNIMDKPMLRKMLPPHMQFKLNNLRNITNSSTNSNNNTMENSRMRYVKI